MAVARMTLTQLERQLAARCDVNNKVARQFMEALAKTALQETKKNGIFVLPGIERHWAGNCEVMRLNNFFRAVPLREISLLGDLKGGTNIG